MQNNKKKNFENFTYEKLINILCQELFNYCYVNSIKSAVAAVLLYLLMPIISKNILNEVNNLTMMIYSFITGAIVLISKVNFTRIGHSLAEMPVLINVVCFGVFSGALAYIYYTTGVKSGIELSVAGVIASIDKLLDGLLWDNHLIR